MKAFFFAAAIGAAVALSPTTSFASTVEVRTADLDLATSAGQAELAGRLDRAARAVCVAGPVTGTRIPSPEDAKCLAETRARINAVMATRIERASQPPALALRKD